MQINLNEIVTYKLTPGGEEILRLNTNVDKYMLQKGLKKSVTKEYREELSAYQEESYERKRTRMQLWEFMKVFGPHMQMGVEPVTEGNMISIGEEKP